MFHGLQHIGTVIDKGIDQAFTGLTAGKPGKVALGVIAVIRQPFLLHHPIHGHPEHTAGHQCGAADGIGFLNHENLQPTTGGDQCSSQTGARTHNDQVDLMVETRLSAGIGRSGRHTETGARQQGATAGNEVTSFHSESFLSAKGRHVRGRRCTR